MNGYRDHFKRMKRLLKYDPAKPDVAARLRWGPDHYPIFINWNAGLGDSIADDLFFIRFGLRVHPAVGIVTSPGYPEIIPMWRPAGAPAQALVG